MRGERKFKALLFFFFVSIYLLCMGNHFVTPFYSIDEEIVILTGRSILERFSLEIPEIYGRSVSHYGILPSLLVIPFYLLGKTLGLVFFPGLENYVSVFFCYTMNAFITALLLVYFYAFSRYLRYSLKTSFYSTLIVGLCSIVFPFAKYFFSAPLVSLTTLASFYHFAKFSRGKKTRDIILSSLWFSLLLLTRIDGISLLPVYAFGFLFIYKKRNSGQISGKLIVRGVSYFMAPVFLAVAAHFFVNFLKYGSFRESGYGNEAFSTSLVHGLYGLLFSPGRSFFLYSPPMILAFFHIARFCKKHPLAAAMIVFASLIRLYLFSKWCQWHGGLSWGPRYIIPLVPLLGLMINEPLSRFKKFPSGVKILILFIIFSGFLVQIIAVLVSPTKTSANVYAMVKGDENLPLFIPHVSAIAGNIDMIRQGVIDTFILDFADKFPPFILIFILVFLTGTLFFSLLRLIKISGCGFRDILTLKSPKSFNSSQRVAALLIIANVILFSLCHIGISSSKIPRFTVITHENGTESSHLHFDSFLCLEERGAPRMKDNGEKAVNMRIKWTGRILLPLKGEYQFHVKSRGKYVLMIDERIISACPEDVGQVTIPANASFDRGYYGFHAEYIPTDLENRIFHIYATFPGLGFYKTLLSNRNVFASPPDIFRRIILFLDNFKMFFVILSIMAWGLARHLIR